ncbi:MAG: c-type cytochrome, partial [Planctomycetales bacterium]|nr:c-type cytochrome [Planctomycetales bacterium]
ILSHYAKCPADIRPRLVELLTQRAEWATTLLNAIAREELPRDTLHINQVRRLQNSHNPAVTALVKKLWGQIREGRNPGVEQAIQQVRTWVREMPGDPVRGHAVFKKTCAQCHQIYGEGEQVGPDITRNGRSSYEQLLSNVFDPNLVIGADYQARTLTTQDGRSLSGLLVEDSPERVVLKLQGGKQEVVARADVDELIVSPLSLMPEGWEKQLPPQEVVDLISFLVLDRPPTEKDAQRLPGAER